MDFHIVNIFTSHKLCPINLTRIPLDFFFPFFIKNLRVWLYFLAETVLVELMQKKENEKMKNQGG